MVMPNQVNCAMHVPARTHRRTVETISRPLRSSVSQLGAGFFFSKYMTSDPPFASGYRAWLGRLYMDNEQDVLGSTVRAVGLAGISNVFSSSQISSEAKRAYCQALTFLGAALDDCNSARSDATLMAIILMGLFEACPLVSHTVFVLTVADRLSISTPGRATNHGRSM